MVVVPGQGRRARRPAAPHPADRPAQARRDAGAHARRRVALVRDRSGLLQDPARPRLDARRERGGRSTRSTPSRRSSDLEDAQRRLAEAQARGRRDGPDAARAPSATSPTPRTASRWPAASAPASPSGGELSRRRGGRSQPAALREPAAHRAHARHGRVVAAVPLAQPRDRREDAAHRARTSSSASRRSRGQEYEPGRGRADDLPERPHWPAGARRAPVSAAFVMQWCAFQLRMSVTTKSRPALRAHELDGVHGPHRARHERRA